MKIRLILCKIALLLVFLTKESTLFAQPVYKISDSRLYLDFYILESELAEGKYLTGNISDLGFVKYNGEKPACTRPFSNRMLTLRAEFIIDSSNVNNSLCLAAMPIDYCCNIYFNGRLIFKRGIANDKYTSRMHYSESIMLSAKNINYNAKNEIAFQLFPKEGEQYRINKVFISDAKDTNKFVFYRNLFVPKLIIALAVCGIVFSIFFFFTYFSRREYQKLHFLYFALMNLFFVISYINNIISYDFANTYLLEKIARIGFPLFMLIGIFFLIDYSNLFKKKKLFKLFLTILYLPAAILIIKGKNANEVVNAYNAYPLVVLILGDVILFIISLLFFRKERDYRSFFIFIVMTLNLFAGFYDGYYFAVLKIKPFILLTPNAVFLINVVIFFVLAVDHTKAYHLAISNSAQLKSINENLELLIAERTKKIVEYSRKLEEANATKDKFFSIIAHDLKNPFNTLIGYSEILKTEFKEFSEDDILEQLNIIYDTSKNGYILLDNLLQWAQTQTDQISFHPEKIQLKKLTQSCIENIANQSQFKDIKVNNNVPEDIEFTGDENQIKTILRNLISNAVKFTSRNGLVVIKAEKNSSDILVSVRDTGVGISERDIQNLFRIDTMFSSPGTNHERGSGLGLILCKEFVEKHSGKIWVESTPGNGSNFKFTIPV